MNWAGVRDGIVADALEEGWAAGGVAGLAPFEPARLRAREAIGSGRREGLPWMSAERIEVSADLSRRYPWARAAISLAWPYRPAATPGRVPAAAAAPGRPRGRMAAYACLDGAETGHAPDYHAALARRCDDLAAWMRAELGQVRVKRFVDHGWAMDRPMAERAGVGFAGKNTTLLTQGAGSYVLLAETVVARPLPSPAPARRSCGRYTACIPACP